MELRDNDPSTGDNVGCGLNVVGGVLWVECCGSSVVGRVLWVECFGLNVVG